MDRNQFERLYPDQVREIREKTMDEVLKDKDKAVSDAVKAERQRIKDMKAGAALIAAALNNGRR